MTKIAMGHKAASATDNHSIGDITKTHSFNLNPILEELKHFLPTQTPLKDFIHHNSLHAFQQMSFYDAIFKASKVFGYQVTLELKDYRKLYEIGRINDDILEQVIVQHKGRVELIYWKNKLLFDQYNEENEPRIGRFRANWKSKYAIDLDNLVQPLLFRIINCYLDQGVASQVFPQSNGGLISSIIALEKNSFTSFFKTKRATNLLLTEHISIPDLLKIVVGNEVYFEQYLFDQQFSHRGWSGMVATVEQQSHVLLDQRPIKLADFILLELLLEIDALESQLGSKWGPLSEKVQEKPIHLFANIDNTELYSVLELWQNAFEWSYYDEVLAGLRVSKSLEGSNAPSSEVRVKFQAIFCIDERECSIRRNIELVDKASETFGAPGFFGVEFYFHPENGKFYDKLCPAPVTPKFLIKESEVHSHREHELLYSEKSTHFIFGLFMSIILGFWAGVKLWLTIFRPKMSPAISNAFSHVDKASSLSVENKSLDDTENGLQIGFTIEEMTNRVEGLLRSIGLIDHFAPLVYIIAHGSSSANNPHHGAHDCGACSGRPGSVNARVASDMANHIKVRDLLKERGIIIPAETEFIGALHDTAADEIQFFDRHISIPKNKERHKINKISFEKALDLNAKERSRRFASIQTKGSLEKVRKAIKDRSVSLFEPRPELGHGTNSLCIVGRRSLTKNIFLDRRAFLNSYDYLTDPEGKVLQGVMRPLGPVCGGINLEYYFSRVDNHKLGAGTKLPHHVMGLIGVANSCDGDLRPGLPLQMIEVHDPIRLLIIVEHFPEIVLKTIQSEPSMYEWFINDWVHLVAINPENNQFSVFKNGVFTEYNPIAKEIKRIGDTNALIESAKEMNSNYIADATKENLSVYALN
ncbi:MAG: DUF2309 domain-containing protein [Bacteroidota bacterium]